MKKKILFFGIYDREHNRNRVLEKGFVANGVEVVHCRVEPKGQSTIRQWIELYRQAKTLPVHSFAYILVPFPGNTIVWLARLLFGKQIIFDAWTSLYDSNVLDRKVYKPNSIKARVQRFLDWHACKLSPIVLLDTNQHIKFFVDEYKLDNKKFVRVLVGADIPNGFEFDPLVSEPENFTVHFHGNLIPLQGVQYVIEAAQLLKNKKIRFNIVVGTKGEAYRRMYRQAEQSGLLSNTVFILDKMPIADLYRKMNQADICLGIFGNTEKTKRVIPNKVYESIAIGKATITADTPAVREIFTNRENILLCNISDPKDLAEKIELLRNDIDLRQTIAKNSKKLHAYMCEPAVIIKKLLETLPSRT